MTIRAVLLASVLPLSGLAQLQLVEVNGTAKTPVVGTTFNVGSATPGDTVQTTFGLVNTGVGPATLETLSLSGQGFNLTGLPQIPYIIAPGFDVEFQVDFTPGTAGSYSAFLQINGTQSGSIDITLTATAAAGASLMLAGGQMALAAGAVINFGSVLVGSSQTQNFTLYNPGTSNLTVNTITVTGTGFAGPIGLKAPLQLTPGQAATFQVTFSPQSGQPAQGTLTVDQRTFNLTAQGLDPPLPSASIVFASSLGASAQQNSVSIVLASASQVPGSGTLTIQFQPSVAGVTDDKTVEFVSGNPTTASFTISPGDTQAQFNGQPNISFQMGATAGTITFTLQFTIPNNLLPQQASLTVAPLPVDFDMESAVRNFGVIAVSLEGFDNTYSASQMAFTFHLLNGSVLSSGVIAVDATSYFQQYFASTTDGGMFALLANFPVNGDTTQIGSVDVQITNSAGVTTIQGIPVGN